MPEFDSIAIGLASPEEIIKRSVGEVESPELTRSQSGKPKAGGLLCEKIFGPVEDYTCACGDYRPRSEEGATCDKCGVEYIQSVVRRERMGHISLAEPVVHRWFFKTRPNWLGNLLGLKSKDLEKVIYYENYIVIQPGSAERLEVEENQLLTGEEYREILRQIRNDNNRLPDDDSDKFIAKIGGEAIETMLEDLDLGKLAQDLRFQAKTETSQHRKDRALRRLKTAEAFREANESGENKPEWMVMQAIPVIPPDLRPVVSLEEVRPAANDVNDLYRRVLIRNNRLKRLIDREAPESTLREERRRLQEAVDALLDNGRMSDPMDAPSGRLLSSLGDRLRGKDGRFQKNLLSKRVDYSGRSVIVPGPRLELHQCGLPKEMAAELFKPFIVRRLMAEGTVETVEEGQKYVDGKTEDVLAVLEEVVQERPVLLSRGPTIDQLGIWAFRPVLTDGKAIELHPLACPIDNAGFDGDELSVHVPLSHEAACESMALMSSSNHLVSPADGDPNLMPTQDIVLGLNYLTKAKSNQKGEGMRFSSVEEVRQAHDQDQIALHAKIKLRDPNGSGEMLDTTTGRVIFNETLPEGGDFVNEVLTTNNIRPVIAEVFKKTSFQETADFLDAIKDMGFRRSTTSGITFSLSDIIIPEEKEQLVEGANEKVQEAERNCAIGFITDNERYNQVINVWAKTNNKVSEVLFNTLKKDKEGFNPIFSMVESGSCGRDEIRQLGGMGGLMARPEKSTGEKRHEILEAPILSNYKEGLSPREYFSSTHGAREALAERTLKRGAADPLARRLMAAAQDEKIVERDCGTLLGIRVGPLKNNEEIVAPLSDRITGRVSVRDVCDPHTDELIVEADELITEGIADRIAQTSIREVEVRSVLTCEARDGICALCYGQDLTTRRLVNVGEHVGGIAALTIGKHIGDIAVPSANGSEGQLTLPTSHVGASALSGPIKSTIRAEREGKVEFEDVQTVTYEAYGEPQEIVLRGKIQLIHATRDIGELTNVITLYTSYLVPSGSELLVEDGQTVEEGGGDSLPGPLQ
jgi:DNA-directed RNA polymerase subunit beta'